jgi:transposase
MTGTKGATPYPYETKREAVRLHEEEGLTYGQIAAQLGIRKAQQIKRWMQQYRQEGEDRLRNRNGGWRKPPPEAERIGQLEMENALLKKYHTELRKALLVKRSIGSSNTTEDGME